MVAARTAYSAPGFDGLTIRAASGSESFLFKCVCYYVYDTLKDFLSALKRVSAWQGEVRLGACEGYASYVQRAAWRRGRDWCVVNKS